MISRPVLAEALPELGKRLIAAQDGTVAVLDAAGKHVASIELGGEINREAIRAAVRYARRIRTRPRLRLPRVGHAAAARVWFALRDKRARWWSRLEMTAMAAEFGRRADAAFQRASALRNALIRMRARRRGLDFHGWESDVLDRLDAARDPAAVLADVDIVRDVVGPAGPVVAPWLSGRDDSAGGWVARIRHVRTVMTPTRGPGLARWHLPSAWTRPVVA